jgi:glycosyltransferase involved in cell wall biosynthesis
LKHLLKVLFGVFKDEMVESMKILHIIAGAEQGGAESCAVDTIRSLHAAGIEQTVICRPHKAFLKLVNDCAIDHHVLSFDRFLKWPQKAKINAIIKKEKPDLVHSWLNRAASFTPHQKTVPVLGWFGGYYDLKYYQSCDFFMGVTKDIVRYIGNVTMTPDRTYVGHAFGTLEPMGEVKKSDYGISDATKVVLMLSRMHWKKGVDLLIDAASKIDDVVFLIAGDGPEIEKYKAQARALNLEGRVLFLGWCKDRLGLLSIADVCVLPSRYEPFGIVIPESWFARVPLVATKADGAKQYVNHEKDGLLVDIDDCEGLIEALHRALYDEALRAQLVKGGTKIYKQLFSRDSVIASLIESYQDMIRRHPNI